MSRKMLLRLVLVLLVVAGVVMGLMQREHFSPDKLESFITELGGWGPVVYIAIWFVAPVLFIPGSPITLTGGALFGPLWGTLYTIVGATGGATLAFLLARYLAGDWVEAKAKGQLGSIRKGVEEEGWRFVAFTRLVPLFPYNLLNYAFGLTGISLKSYFITSFFCMLPGTVGYIYLGYAGREALMGGENLVQKGLAALAVVAALVLLPIMIRRRRAASRGRAASGMEAGGEE